MFSVSTYTPYQSSGDVSPTPLPAAFSVQPFQSATTPFQSNWEYRETMTKGGVAIAARNFKDACMQSGASSTIYPSVAIPVDTDLKQTYLNRQQLAARKVTPSFAL